MQFAPILAALKRHHYAGVIAVPAPFQTRNRGRERIRAIAADAQVDAIARLPGGPAGEWEPPS